MASTGRKAAAAAATAAAMSDGPSGFLTRLASIPRLVRDVLSGRYNGLSRRRLLLMLLGVVYVVSPVDLLPEALLTIPGLADDAAVATWLVASALGATTAYRIWENGRAADADGPVVIPGEVVSGREGPASTP
jgi:uncharacterized membrane protein YkvA (DUF1232 family)